jgi:hypothetical protein
MISSVLLIVVPVIASRLSGVVPTAILPKVALLVSSFKPEFVCPCFDRKLDAQKKPF